MISSDSTAFIKLWNPYLTDLYWHDQNGDGRIGEKEIHFIPSHDHWPDRAARLLQSINPNFSGEASKIERYESLRDYFDHPEKRSFALQLVISIQKLEQMDDRPSIYSTLLDDLRLIQQELPHTRFRYAAENELPANTHAQYDIHNSVITTRHNPPTALLIHEMDHAVTSHRRTDRKAIERYPQNENWITSFEFYLDYPLSSEDSDDPPIRIRYDSIAEASIFLFAPDEKSLMCPSDESIEASVANEVHAFQTTARFWIFQLGITADDLNKMSEDSHAKNRFLESLETLCHEKLSGTLITEEEAYQILLHYFDEGGWFNSNLKDYVEKVYAAGTDPRFVETENCIEGPESNSGCGSHF